jgi:hypothetical protein
MHSYIFKDKILTTLKLLKKREEWKVIIYNLSISYKLMEEKKLHHLLITKASLKYYKHFILFFYYFILNYAVQ